MKRLITALCLCSLLMLTAGRELVIWIDEDGNYLRDYNKIVAAVPHVLEGPIVAEGSEGVIVTGEKSCGVYIYQQVDYVWPTTNGAVGTNEFGVYTNKVLVPRKYTKWDGDVGMVKMTQEEMDAKDAADAAAVSNARVASAEAWIDSMETSSANATSTPAFKQGLRIEGRALQAEDVQFLDHDRGVILLDSNGNMWLVSVDTNGAIFSTQISSSPEIPFAERVARKAAREVDISDKRNSTGQGQLQQRIEAVEAVLKVMGY